mmetsp:Transcript_17414/g.29302  ORF Transcript_17414/g.29302 Transcript_17414/m.29302 type:complete len:107 (+) Transcript_17414:985-1305(+)
MIFIEEPDILLFVVQTFRKLYNQFPAFRPSLEDPLISALISSVILFKRETEQLEQRFGREMANDIINHEVYSDLKEQVSNIKLPPRFYEVKNLYTQSQVLVNFLLD